MLPLLADLARAAGPDAAGSAFTRPEASAFVDYAHKPEALTKALEALRPHTGRAPGRRVRLRRRPRCRQAPADGRDRGAAGGRGRSSPTTTRAPRIPAAIRRAVLAAAPRRSRDRRPGGGDPDRFRRAPAPATRCSSPARAMRPTRSSATGRCRSTMPRCCAQPPSCRGDAHDRALDRRGCGRRRPVARLPATGSPPACRSTRARWRRATCSWRWSAPTAMHTPLRGRRHSSAAPRPRW